MELGNDRFTELVGIFTRYGFDVFEARVYENDHFVIRGDVLGGLVRVNVGISNLTTVGGGKRAYRELKSAVNSHVLDTLAAAAEQLKTFDLNPTNDDDEPLTPPYITAINIIGDKALGSEGNAEAVRSMEDYFKKDINPGPRLETDEIAGTRRMVDKNGKEVVSNKDLSKLGGKAALNAVLQALSEAFDNPKGFSPSSGKPYSGDFQDYLKTRGGDA